MSEPRPPGAIPSDGLSTPLTVVQWEVVERLDAGDSAPAAAIALRCSPATVRAHIRAIALKLSPELTADLEPIQAIIVWRRWLRWLEDRDRLPARRSA